MDEEKFFTFIKKQLFLLTSGSLFAGSGVTLLSIYYGETKMSLSWFFFLASISLWGFFLYYNLNYLNLEKKQFESWYTQVKLFLFFMFGSWTILFIIYTIHPIHNLQQVVLFTQIGATVMASAFLFSDKKISIPILSILIFPMIIHFTMMQEAHGYFLALYAILFMFILNYVIGRNQKLIDKMYYLAQHDSLTGLYNRRYLTDYLEYLITSANTNKKHAYIMLIDIDYFKTINDTLGHIIGDKLLIEISNRLNSFCEDTHTIARIGGDEFMLISNEFDSYNLCTDEANNFTPKLIKTLSETYIIDNQHIKISTSIGINKIGNELKDMNTIIKEADIAMYEAKMQGRDRYVDYSEEIFKRTEKILQIERKLHFAIQNNEIRLVYQPQVNAEKNIIGCEVLTRWHNKELGDIPPDDFIKVAEKTGQIINLGRYILVESFKTLRRWDKSGLSLKQFSINISVRQFLHSSFIEQIKKLSDKYLTQSLRKKLVFEVTETLLAEDIEKIISIVNKLKQLNISVSMDDFGTGYSSLSFLREMPISELKIDSTFIDRLNEGESDRMMVSTILSLADIFDLKVVAEGVETKEQFSFLLSKNCNIFQGFYFSKPLEREKFEDLYFSNKNKDICISA